MSRVNVSRHEFSESSITIEYKYPLYPRHLQRLGDALEEGWHPNHDANEDAPTATGTPSMRAARPPNHGGDGNAMEKRQWDVSSGNNNAMARQRGDVWGDWVAEFQVARDRKKRRKFKRKEHTNTKQE
ncbi:hypothetical protein EDB85DRAFT_1896456 [Lactarius pseudohatsudake]|nr:hypothetical protein EDB85DRAFT_1896456 [Lactarius pseudohatsudake]